MTTLKDYPHGNSNPGYLRESLTTRAAGTPRLAKHKRFGTQGRSLLASSVGMQVLGSAYDIPDNYPCRLSCIIVSEPFHVIRTQQRKRLWCQP